DGFRFVQGSVLDELILDELVNESDVVIHLAAAVGVQLIVDQPLRCLTTNIRGSENVIEAAHRYRRKILTASTSEIYGTNSDGPLAVGDVFNVGSQDEISMLALATRIRELAGSDSQVELVPYEDAYGPGFADMRRRVPDTSKLEALTGWTPTRNLDDILNETI